MTVVASIFKECPGIVISTYIILVNLFKNKILKIFNNLQDNEQKEH